MSNVSNIQGSLFEAMKIFSDNSKKDGTLIIECLVKNIIDAGLKKYTVEYLDNLFEASSSGRSYTIGDKVYVVIPKGDFTKEKVIIGATASASVMDNEIAELQYSVISDNLITNTELLKAKSLNSYNNEISTFDNIFKDNTNKSVLSKYLKDYRDLELSFEVMTDLDDIQQLGGNYGIEMQIPILVTSADSNIKISKTKDVILDVGNMSGNPYRLTDWSKQSTYLFFAENEEYDSSRNISARIFCYGFNEGTSQEKDIFIRNISLRVVRRLEDLFGRGYHLKLNVSQGTYFTAENEPVKTLTPALYLDGLETDIKNADVYWFRENAKIDKTDDAYFSFGGQGWECLNAKINEIVSDNGNVSYSFNLKQYTYDVNGADVGESIRYKCIAIVDKVISEDIIELHNLAADKWLILEKTKPDSIFYKDMGYVELSAFTFVDGVTNLSSNSNDIKYYWSRKNNKDVKLSDADNFYQIVSYNEQILKNNKNCFLTKVKFPVSAVDTQNTVYCSAYYNDKLIGTKALVITTTEDKIFRVFIENDDVVYKYDTDGDSPLSPKFDGPISSVIKDIAPLKFRITKPDGEELTKEEYNYVKAEWKIPKNSLFILNESDVSRRDDNYYYSEKKELSYRIADRFNMTKSKNSNISLNISYDNININTNSNIIFLKEGNLGSNGTVFAAALISCGTSAETSAPYGALSENGLDKKLKFLYNIIGTEKKLYYYNYEYKQYKLITDGLYKIYPKVWINDTLTDNYSCEYSMFDSKSTNPCLSIVDRGNNTCSLNINNRVSFNKNETYCNIVQAKITISSTEGNDSVSGSPQILYAYYPIEFTVVEGLIPKIEPELTGGFAEVMYATDGTNPEYDDYSPFYCRDMKATGIIPEEIKDYFDITWHSSDNIKLKNSDTKEYVIAQPVNKYDSGNSKNYVKTVLEFKDGSLEDFRQKKEDCDTEISNIDTRLAEIEKIKTEAKVSFVNKFNAESAAIQIHDNNVITFVRNMSAVNTAINSRLVPSIEELDSYFNITNSSNTDINRWENTLKLEINKLQNTLSSIGYDKNIEVNTLNTISENRPSNIPTELVLYIENIIDDIKALNSKINAVKSGGDAAAALYCENYSNFVNVFDILKNISSNTDNEYYKLGVNAKAFLTQSFNRVLSTAEIAKVIKALYQSILSGKYTKDENDNLLFALDAQIKAEEDQLGKDRQTARAKSLEYANILSYYNESNRASYISHTRPIVFYYNRYGMSHLNAWDGNKIETADGYLLAPQVGAGKKETDNSFTGVLIGQRNSDNGNKVGLFGYNHGEQTILLDSENGSAIFGKSGAGQIIMDPSSNQAIIKSGNYSTSNKTGMLIDLTTPEIKFGSGKFSVDADGQLTAKGGGQIAGWNIGDTALTSTNSKITLDADNSQIVFEDSTAKIYSGNHNVLSSVADGFYLSHDGLSIGSGFCISANGTTSLLKENSNIGGWKINTDGQLVSQNETGILLDSGNSSIILGSSNGKIYSGGHTSLGATNNGFYLANDGLSIGKSIKISDSTVEVGNINSKHWTISGSAKNSYIGYNIDSFNVTKDGTLITAIKNDTPSESVYIGTDGFTLGRKFAVDNNGSLFADSANFKDVVITGGSFNINNSAIIKSTGAATFSDITITGGSLNIGGNAVISNNGTATFKKISITNDVNNSIDFGDKFKVDANGASINGAITATSGKIGNWSISDGAITNGNTTLTSDGKLTASDVNLTGIINATGGKIGNCNISTTEISMVDGSNNGWRLKDDGEAIFTRVIINNNSNSGSITFGNSFSVSSSGVTVNGNIVATSGVIGQCSINNGRLEVPAAHITGKLTAGQIETGGISISTLDGYKDVITYSNIGGVEISADKITSGIIRAGVIGFTQNPDKKLSWRTLTIPYITGTLTNVQIGGKTYTVFEEGAKRAGSRVDVVYLDDTYQEYA